MSQPLDSGKQSQYTFEALNLVVDIPSNVKITNLGIINIKTFDSVLSTYAPTHHRPTAYMVPSVIGDDITLIMFQKNQMSGAKELYAQGVSETLAMLHLGKSAELYDKFDNMRSDLDLKLEFISKDYLESVDAIANNYIRKDLPKGDFELFPVGILTQFLSRFRNNSIAMAGGLLAVYNNFDNVHPSLISIVNVVDRRNLEWLNISDY